MTHKSTSATIDRLHQENDQLLSSQRLLLTLLLALPATPNSCDQCKANLMSHFEGWAENNGSKSKLSEHSKLPDWCSRLSRDDSH